MAKKCKVCKEPFEPRRPLQKVCSLTCSIDLVKQEKVKKVKDETREMKKLARDKDKPYWTKKAQEVFNQWIRVRDDKQPCISCGNWGYCQWHAGHYKSVGSTRGDAIDGVQLRFYEDNVHKQCAQCNNFKSGNIGEYRPRLQFRIGLERLERLDGPHHPVKYTIDDLKGIVKKYRAKIKESEQHESNTESRETTEDY
jgi:hypothetical protein